MSKTEKNQELAAAKAGMDRKTARDYLGDGRLPSERKEDRNWRTRSDPFTEVWERIREQIATNPGLEARTLFEALQRQHPGKFADGQLRTLQRRLKHWRATAGPEQEVFFGQQHVAGRLGQSDFTRMGELNITIGGQSFPHLLYHFVLTYSNWEDVSLCYSESFESLSDGLQNALWELGGAPLDHRTDRMSLAVNNASDEREFTTRYEALLRHYKMTGQMIQAGKANENGDVEQRHYRLKRAVDQSLLLRDGRDFPSVEEYKKFVRALVVQLNAGRRERLRRDAVSESAAGGAAGKHEAGAGESGFRQPDLRGSECVLSAQPSDPVRKVEARLGAEDCGSLVCRAEGGRTGEITKAAASTASITGTSSTGWCGSQGHLRTIATERSYFRRARFRMAWDALRETSPAARQQTVPGDSGTGGEGRERFALMRRCAQSAGDGRVG